MSWMSKTYLKLIVRSGWIMLQMVVIMFAMNSGGANFVYQNF